MCEVYKSRYCIYFIQYITCTVMQYASKYINYCMLSNSCPMLLTVVYSLPGTGGVGGDLEPSSIGRFCW